MPYFSFNSCEVASLQRWYLNGQALLAVTNVMLKANRESARFYQDMSITGRMRSWDQYEIWSLRPSQLFILVRIEQWGFVLHPKYANLVALKKFEIFFFGKTEQHRCSNFLWDKNLTEKEWAPSSGEESWEYSSGKEKGASGTKINDKIIARNCGALKISMRANTWKQRCSCSKEFWCNRIQFT